MATLSMPVAFNKAFPVTKSDTVDLEQYAQFGLTHGLYIGATGTVVAVWEDGTTSTFVGCLAGTVLPVAVRRVNSTSTTAATVLALYQI